MSRRAARYVVYLVVLVAAAAIIQQNAWKIPIYRYQLDAKWIRHVTEDPPDWEYYLHVPKGYDSERKWPLFVYVHGTRGGGRDALHIWRPYADQEGFFYLAPTFPDEGYTHLDGDEGRVLWRMIAEVGERYAIDDRCVFVAGFSGGAQFAHRFAFRYPKYVCAVSAMSAGSYDAPPQSGRPVPFVVSVGEDDVERTDLALWFARELRRGGYEVHYQVFPEVGHWLCPEAVQLTIEAYKSVRRGGDG